MELNPFTVLKHFKLPHCPEGEHQAEDAEGNPIGVVPCEHKEALMLPGQTAHLSDAQAQELIASGHVAPPGAAITQTLSAAPVSAPEPAAEPAPPEPPAE